MTSIEARQKGESAQDPSGKTMTPWTFDIKFPLGTQFIFGSLTFVVEEHRDLKMLSPGPAPEHPTPAPSSTSGGACSDLDSFAGLYIRTAKLIRGYSERDIHPPAIQWSTEFIFIGIVPQPRFIC
jgi:hypothetical protein